MCTNLYSFCADCNNFYPSNRKIKVKKRECRNPNCNATKLMLLDCRHDKCKPIKKKGLLGKKAPEESVRPVEESMLTKLSRLESKGRPREESRRPQGSGYEPSETSGEGLKFTEFEDDNDFWAGESAGTSKWLTQSSPWNDA